METPLYVIKALAEVHEGGEVNMLDRQGVAGLSPSSKAEAWILKATPTEYMQALNDMGEYITINPDGEDDDADESGEDLDDERNGNYTY
jgi:hypothetical protein